MDKLQKRTEEVLRYEKQPREFLETIQHFMKTMQDVYRSKISDEEMRLWKETLKGYSFQEFEKAMKELVSNPPRYELEDGSIQVWRGMPKLPDVVQVMLENREKAYLEHAKRERDKEIEELKVLEKRREEHPEEFIGMKDLYEIAQKAIGKGSKILVMPPEEKEKVSPILLGQDGGKRERELKEQAEKLMRESNDSAK